jgi:PAS domain S-box-containing protein
MQRLNRHLPQLQNYLKKHWRRLPVIQRGTIVITIPLLCLVTSLTAHLWLIQRSVEVEKWVNHSQRVLIESRTLLVDMLNAETGARGYYIARQPEFLQPFRQALTTLPQTFERLKPLTQDNPIQSERVKTLNLLVNQRLSMLEFGIQQIDRAILNRTPTNPRTLPLVQGKANMDQFRATLAQLQIEEQRLLDARQQSLNQQRAATLLVILLGIMISSLGSAIAIGLFKDLTQDLRQRESSLKESHNLLRAVFAHVVDGVVVLNAQSQIEEFNRAAEQMFGYSLPELAGHHWRQLLTSETDPHATALPARAEIPERPCQAMGKRQDGTQFPVEFSVSSIKLDDRQIVIIRDVTERQQAAAKLQGRADELARLNLTLRATNQALSERNRELDQFAYVVSHDLKSPLRAIAYLSAWIEEDLAAQLSPESQKHMELLRGRVYRIETLLNGLLDYGRIGRMAVPVETVDVADLLGHVLQTLAPPPTFQVEIDPAMPTLLARKFLLRQVFLHLIENAIDHHPTVTGRVSVSVQDQGDRYGFAIADNGQGIDPRFHTKIYTIFQTLQARDIHESPGVGLAVVKKIVEMEGGSIQLESVVGQGATFRFTWPKQPPQQSPAAVTFIPIDRSV